MKKIFAILAGALILIIAGMVFYYKTVKPVQGEEKQEISFSYIQKLTGEIANKYKMFRLTLNEEEARKRTVDWALKQDKVKQAGVSPDKETIYIILENGEEIYFLAPRR